MGEAEGREGIHLWHLNLWVKGILAYLAFFISSLLHVVVEFAGFLFIGIAFSLLTVALVKKRSRRPLLKNVLVLVVLAVACVALGAVLETTWMRLLFLGLTGWTGVAYVLPSDLYTLALY